MSDEPAAGAPPEIAAGSEFWQDPGPAFNPETAPEIPDGVEDQAPGEPAEVGWTAERVVSVLQEIQAPVFNGVVNWAAGVRDVDWHHRQARLEAIAPAIAREWNKIDVLRSLAGKTDRALIVSYLTFEYLGPRVVLTMAERKQIERQRREQAARAQAAQNAGLYTGPVPAPAVEPDSPEQPEPPPLADIPPRRR